jgi:hypothetical protein
VQGRSERQLIALHFPLQFVALAKLRHRSDRGPVVLKYLLQLVLGIIWIVDNDPVVTRAVSAKVVAAAAYRSLP